MARLTGKKVKINILNKQDFRNYKVSFEKARTLLGYMPTENVSDMIESIYSRLDEYGDLDTERFYNIRVFKKLEAQQL
ncbi:MAG: hypothetical protein COX19_08995 [Desulfobacterales bacterium CG23_combo_of_CG06-09_8_20_14_all_51_8]|nr:MAG: hypothetical protein COX19_08995 [Desulfobacterales bacterium CG23_combo_of_CG06-09_8_20_14_all_51_8]